jgi:hypothetical protein
LSSGDIRRAADAWAEIALGEHASIPSFARFVMELVAVGAPPELLTRAAAAISDEVRHARMAFSMAGELLGHPVGPSEIDISGALTKQPEIPDICIAAFVDGCIEEGIAAEQARLAAAECSGRGANIWRIVAKDEYSHAELAWSSVEWMLTKQPKVASNLRGQLQQVKYSLHNTVLNEDREGLLKYGIVSRRRIAQISVEAFAEKIYPRACSLIERSA